MTGGWPSPQEPSERWVLMDTGGDVLQTQMIGEGVPLHELRLRKVWGWLLLSPVGWGLF